MRKTLLWVMWWCAQLVSIVSTRLLENYEQKALTNIQYLRLTIARLRRAFSAYCGVGFVSFCIGHKTARCDYRSFTTPATSCAKCDEWKMWAQNGQHIFRIAEKIKKIKRKFVECVFVVKTRTLWMF